jgi:hypothetical protein
MPIRATLMLSAAMTSSFLNAIEFCLTNHLVSKRTRF